MALLPGALCDRDPVPYELGVTQSYGSRSHGSRSGDTSHVTPVRRVSAPPLTHSTLPGTFAGLMEMEAGVPGGGSVWIPEGASSVQLPFELAAKSMGAITGGNAGPPSQAHQELPARAGSPADHICHIIGPPGLTHPNAMVWHIQADRPPRLGGNPARIRPASHAGNSR